MRYLRTFAEHAVSDDQPEWLLAPGEDLVCTVRVRRAGRDEICSGADGAERLLFVMEGQIRQKDLPDANAGDVVFLPPGSIASLVASPDSLWIEMTSVETYRDEGPDGPGAQLFPLLRDRFQGEGFAWQSLADRSRGVRSLRLNVMKVAPGSGSPDFHIHAFAQVYVVQHGEMTIDIGRAQYVAGPRTLVYLPAGVAHRNYNASKATEQHMSMMLPEPEDGMIFDYAVTIHDHEAPLMQPQQS